MVNLKRSKSSLSFAVKTLIHLLAFCRSLKWSRWKNQFAHKFSKLLTSKIHLARFTARIYYSYIKIMKKALSHSFVLPRLFACLEKWAVDILVLKKRDSYQLQKAVAKQRCSRHVNKMWWVFGSLHACVLFVVAHLEEFKLVVFSTKSTLLTTGEMKFENVFLTGIDKKEKWLFQSVEDHETFKLWN